MDLLPALARTKPAKKIVARNQQGCAIFSESFVPDNLYCDRLTVHQSFCDGVVLPLTTMIIVVVFLFWLNDMTPGKIMAREIERTKAGTGAGEFLVRECPLPQTQPGLPVAEVPVTDLKSGEGCLVVVTDAAGYADRVNTSLRDWLANVWLILALMFTIPGVFRSFIRGLARF
ncbi:TPA: conjugal transfer protein TraP [Salmonella enterica subsp. diarizonae serovar 61:r:-]